MLVGCLKIWLELNLQFSLIILVNNLPVKWRLLLQKYWMHSILITFLVLGAPFPIRGGWLLSAKNGLCRRRAGTGDWVGWSEKLKNANLERMQNKVGRLAC